MSAAAGRQRWRSGNTSSTWKSWSPAARRNWKTSTAVCGSTFSSASASTKPCGNPSSCSGRPSPVCVTRCLSLRRNRASLWIAIHNDARFRRNDKQRVTQTGEGLPEQLLGFPQGFVDALALENVEPQTAVEVFQLRRAAGDQLFQVLLVFPERHLGRPAAPDIQHQNRIDDDQEQGQPHRHQRGSAVPQEKRRRLVDDLAALGKSAGADAPPLQLGVVEYVAVGTIGREPHHRNGVGRFAAEHAQGDLAGGLALVESADQLSADDPEPEVEIPGAVDRRGAGPGNGGGALVVFEEPAGAIARKEGIEDQALRRQFPEGVQQLRHAVVLEKREVDAAGI